MYTCEVHNLQFSFTLIPYAHCQYRTVDRYIRCSNVISAQIKLGGSEVEILPFLQQVSICILLYPNHCLLGSSLCSVNLSVQLDVSDSQNTYFESIAPTVQSRSFQSLTSNRSKPKNFDSNGNLVNGR